MVQGKKKRPTMGAGVTKTPVASTSTGSAASKPAAGTQTGSTPTAARSTGKATPRSAVGYGPQGSAIRRQSVAANRPTKGSNKTQLYILGAAAVVIALVVVLGIVLNKSNSTINEDGYGNSKNGVAALGANGVIAVDANTTPPVTIDVYEDPICPFCGAFERDYGQQIAKAIDEGKLRVNYNLLNFLDKASGSGNYSTRAVAALQCAGAHIGSTKGAWAAFHAALYSSGVQPEEGGSDLTNDQLIAQMKTAATGAGVPADSADLAAAASCVTNGDMLASAAATYTASAAALTAVLGQVSTPAIVHNGAIVDINADTAWLTKLIA